MITAIYIVGLLLIVQFPYNIYKRMQRVEGFHRELTDLIFAHNRRAILRSDYNLIDYDIIPGFYKMTFSLKPLTLKAWFTEEQIKELLA